MKYSVRIHDKTFSVEVRETAGAWHVLLDGKEIPMDAVEVKPPHLYSFLVGNRSFDVEVVKNSEGYIVHLEGRTYECFLEDERVARLKRLAGFPGVSHKDKELKAPMPGLILAVEVKEGDRVKAGQGLVIIEAMKMENEIRASFDAAVKSIKVNAKQAVERNEVLMIFE
jgi:acetyl/propionyl-CoA carboxylase alpha subunit